MLQAFILNDKRLEVEIKQMQVDSNLLDITSVGELWRRITPVGETRLELDAVATDGTEIQGVFRIIRRREDGTIEIEPWSDLHQVGGKSK
jgi:hypothetical protein